MRKGQGSTEYLVLLAVALIIALVVIGLLGWFPGLAGGARETQSRSYWKGAVPLGIIEYKISDDDVTLVLRNNEDQRLTVTDIEVGGESIGIASTSINSGEEKAINGTLDGGVESCDNAGDGFEYNVTFIYDTRNIADNVQVGDKPLIGKCS